MVSLLNMAIFHGYVSLLEGKPSVYWSFLEEIIVFQSPECLIYTYWPVTIWLWHVMTNIAMENHHAINR